MHVQHAGLLARHPKEASATPVNRCQHPCGATFWGPTIKPRNERFSNREEASKEGRAVSRIAGSWALTRDFTRSRGYFEAKP
jgi:hypothetical protein